MKQFLSIFCLLCTLMACKNYIGNPHKTVMTARTVPAVPNNLRVEPANWWVGMQHKEVEILLQRPDLAAYTVKLGQTDGVKLAKVEQGSSPNYLFVTLTWTAKTPPQRVPLIFTKGSSTFTHEYPLRPRTTEVKAQGVNTQDVLYLIFPDRFANGDPSNDNVPGMLQGLQRDSLVGRHGGDLRGISNHLDYIQDLGISAIWLNTELENDQADASYHGYAVTDHYRVDRRFGSNEQLRTLIGDCHQRGLKVIRDVVLNHIGDNHYWMRDLPTQDWVNQWPVFTRTTYRAPTLMDPYAPEADQRLFTDGWFDKRMPDLNQRNPHVANYLIQQAIWWIEYAGFDDLRIDTYTYSDQAFCSRWCRELRAEYPRLGIFGEIWEQAVPIQGYFADDQPMSRGNFDKYKSGMAMLLTMRGIPQIYYATEILGTGNANPSHGNIHQDFPGGWAGDPVNKFTDQGRTAQENEAYNYARTLIHYHRATPALQNGRLMQFVPQDGVYTYFRYDEAKTVMVVINTANEARKVNTARFAERMQGFSAAHDVVTGLKIADLQMLNLGKNAAVVLELEK